MLDHTEDEAMLADAVTRFCRDRLADALPAHSRDHRFPTDLVREFGELGYLGTAYDPDWGGAGLGTRGAAIVAEILARTDPSFAAVFLCNSAPASLIARFGSDALKAEFLEPVCTGRMIGSFGVTEPHGGSDVANIRTRAVRDGDDWILSGAKIFSTNAGTPLHGFSTVVAVTNPDKGPKGLTSFVVPVGTDGFSVGRAAPKIGWRFADSVELYFEGVRIPDRYRVGEEGDGLRQVLSVLSIGRVLVAATGLGLARRAIDLSVGFGRDRRLFGKSILEHQGLAFPLADVLTGIHAAELMVRHSATLIDSGKPFRNETSKTKLFASQLAVDAALKAVQVHGALGVFEDCPASSLIGEAKVLEIVEGTSEIQRMVIARELMS